MKPHTLHTVLLKRFICLTAVIFSCVSLVAQQQGFPYTVVIDTVVGDCFNNCQAVVTLYDGQGNVIQTDDSLHHPVDSVAYPITNLHYHYKNQLYNSVFYSDSHILTVDVGTYDIGVSGYVMVQMGTTQVPVLVDTTLYGIILTSTYNPFSASMLAGIAGNNIMVNGVWREQCGNRYALPCINQGRVQMKLTAGKFPYTVIFTDAQGDTIRHVVFDQRQHSGNDSLFADYKDYFTFDDLPAGLYRIEAYDACSYTLVFHHTVELNNVTVGNLNFNTNNPYDSNTVCFSAHYYSTKGVYNYYDYSLFDSIFQYRFIHTDTAGQSDTSSWHPIDGYAVLNTYDYYCDTLGFAHRYCDLYGHTVRFEIRDLCHHDSLYKTLTLSPPNPSCLYTFTTESVFCLGEFEDDTCASVCDTMISLTQQHCIWYSCAYSSLYYTSPLQWIYTDSASQQVIKTDQVGSISSTSALTNTEVENIYGSYSSLSLPIVRTLVDAQGCVLLSRFDTLLFVRDTTSDERPFTWNITSNVYSSCYGESSVSVYEYPTPFPLFRDSVVVRLIESPLYDKFNFTATYAQGEWTIVKDDTVNNDATIVAQGMNVSIRKSGLPGGLYIFVCETVCGIDTLQINIGNAYYTTWEWIEDPVYNTEQECNDLLVFPIAGKYRQYSYYINSYVSNDVPVVTYNDFFPSIVLLSGEVGGYSTTSTSMNVPFRFTIPGDYVIKMYFWGCDEYAKIDTIHFVRVRVDFEKAYAVVCDSTANIGSVIVRAINGSPPYTYKVYSQPDMHGSLLGTNQSGLFYDIPMQLGQEMSVYVIDSCENSYYINIVAMSIDQSQLLWFEGGPPDPGICAGDTVMLSSLPFNNYITSLWSGPENFTATGEHISFYAADTSSSGWLVVELLNTGCATSIKDSIYLNVLCQPQVFISTLDTVCAGDTVQVDISALGNETVYFNLGHFYAGTQSLQPLSISTQDTLSLFFPIETENLFWVSDPIDLYCPGYQSSDTIQVSPYPVPVTTDSVSVSAENLLVCFGSDAMFTATSDLSTPCILNWYDNGLLCTGLQQDTLHALGDASVYTVPELLMDTTLYMVLWYQDNCPAHIGRMDLWMNMQNGTTVIQPGQGVRLYDSGGDENPYSNNETLTHTFQSPDVGFFLVRFHDLLISEGDTLFLYAAGGSLVGSYTGSTLPADLTILSNTLTFKFVSNPWVNSSGWSLDILIPSALSEVSASVVHFFDTLTTSICQTDELFSFPPFSQIDISDTGLLQLDTLLTSIMGCDSSISLTINVLPVKSSVVDTVICEGREMVMGSHHYTDEGTYICNFTAENGCDSVVTLELGVIGSSTEIVSSEDDFCDHYSTILSLPDLLDDYNWSTGEHSPFIEVQSPGSYTVTAHYQGCEIKAYYFINTCLWELYLPNAITPGKPDGLNDVFCLLEDQKFWIEDFELYIYNRWGELVYSAQDKNFKWDGTVNGQIFPNNIYNYIIRLTDKNGRKQFYKGFITTLG